MTRHGSIRVIILSVLFLAFFISYPRIGFSIEKGDSHVFFENLELPLKDAPGGKVIIENGQLEKGYPVDSSNKFHAAIEKVATSSWKGTKVAALVLAYETGGSGNFKTLFFLSNREGKWLPKAWLQLGDRIKVRYLSLYRHGLVFLGMVKHKESDPMCCPTQRLLKVYEISGHNLKTYGTYKADIFPDEIKCNLALLNEKAKLELIPQISFSPHGQGLAWGMPTHVGLVTQENKIIMRIINAQEYIDLWFKEHDPTINIAISRLKRAIKKEPYLLSTPFDILPPRPGINDFAVSISKISFKNGTGIGFIGRVVKDLVCIDKSQLKFFYMGLDNSQKYLITFSKKVSVGKDLPPTIWICKTSIEGLKKQRNRLKKVFQDMGIDKLCPDYSRFARFISTVEINIQKR